jgi:P4 family phage/plasmid primase-like protien
MYNKGDFYTYLSGYRVEKGCEYTHTSITKPAGSFYIPSEKIDEYMDIYRQAYLANEDLYVTEKHRDICSILIDIDLRFDKDSKVRNYDQEFIVDILKIYCDKINNYVNIPDNLKIYVMEKSKPSIDKNFQKDGVHIIIPGIVTKPTVQYLVRQEILDDPRFDELYKKYNILNGKEDILDKAVIYKNNWQMYGSKKPQCEAYKITKIYTLNKDLAISLDSGEINHGELIELMSIRNKYESTKIKIEKLPVIEEFDKKENNKKMHKNPALQANQNNKKNVITDSELELVEKLIDILDVKRSDSFDSWIRVGWCFRNIDNRLLDKWIEFSKKNAKFQEGECEKLWPYMKSDGLGMGTLHMWAKNDNEEKYRDICNKDLTLLFEKSTSETHTDIAKVVHYLYKYDYVCVCNAKNLWYEFRNHRWVSCDNAHTLKSRMSNEVVNEYRKKITYYNQKAIDDEANKDNYDNIVKKLVSISSKLKTVPFKNNIVSELRDLFYIDKFEEKLDSKCTLIGFENGVYDLEMAEFRDGRPDDYISFSTNINYIPYNPEHRNVIEMHEFVSKIFTVPALKQYVLTLLSSFLNGNIREEKFHIWTGSGSNGKSKFIELFERSFGGYCVKFPITLLTQKRASSNSATSELARAKGKRFASLQEPSEDEKLNIGLMKEISGGDTIQARMLYKEPIEFKPQFKMILACNHLPSIPSDDGGTWRRIRVVEFTSKFCENPNPEILNEFLMDKELSLRFDEWREYFMSMLIEYHKEYIKNGIKEPEEVLKCTREYQRSNDCYLDFVESELEKSPDNSLNKGEAHTCFKLWVVDNAPLHFKNIVKKTFTTALDKILSKGVQNIAKLESWKGWAFKNKNIKVDDLDH